MSSLLLDALEQLREVPKMKQFWIAAIAFAEQNRRERRPFQRLLAQNRFELEIAKKLGIWRWPQIIMSRSVRFWTLIELPPVVRFWLALWYAANLLRKRQRAIQTMTMKKYFR